MYPRRLAPDIFRVVKRTENQVGEVVRRLENIELVLHWGMEDKITQAIGGDFKPRNGKSILESSPEELQGYQSAVISATSKIEQAELRNLLSRSGSAISLTLERTNDDTISVAWDLEGIETSPRFSAAEICPGLPRPGPPRTEANGPSTFNSTESVAKVLSAAFSQKEQKSRSSFTVQAVNASLLFPSTAPFVFSTAVVLNVGVYNSNLRSARVTYEFRKH
jgi:hypothetical protein